MHLNPILQFFNHIYICAHIHNLPFLGQGAGWGVRLNVLPWPGPRSERDVSRTMNGWARVLCVNRPAVTSSLTFEPYQIHALDGAVIISDNGGLEPKGRLLVQGEVLVSRPRRPAS